MKKILLIIALLLCTSTITAQDVIFAYIVDQDPTTNVRNAPGGKVVTTINNDGNGYVVTLLKEKNGWWLIDATINAEGDDPHEIQLNGSKTGYWIHNSVIGFTAIGDGTAILHSGPSYKSRKLCEYVQLMHPIDVKGKWVKVKTDDGKHTGWIHRDKICYNPLTTCP
ncbi:MAG: SH3 domain-containing protein [Muribaculaceae bacterium]|nr:SH3 domain-containing protein [Muribaculaceae bacterium]